jgi:hypothetical protein
MDISELVKTSIVVISWILELATSAKFVDVPYVISSVIIKLKLTFVLIELYFFTTCRGGW